MSTASDALALSVARVNAVNAPRARALTMVDSTTWFGKRLRGRAQDDFEGILSDALLAIAACRLANIQDPWTQLVDTCETAIRERGTAK